MPFDATREAVLMTVKGSDGPPSLAEAAEQLGLPVDELDPAFGVVMVSPRRGLYSVRVAASALGDGFDPEKGPYSDPKIAPMR
ncbi:MAG: hypothetical protein H7X93_12380 [Sphingomonadaceae bacterium]|nr:hypothetical protein [Sphingomonadaceae bacterium]